MTKTKQPSFATAVGISVAIVVAIEMEASIGDAVLGIVGALLTLWLWSKRNDN